MSTRSRIGIIRSTDPTMVESVYCHFDGYPEGVGQTLLDHWSDEAKINKLIALGDLSALGSVIGEKHDFDTHTGTWENGEYTESEASKAGWCLFYQRDRDEKNCGSVTHPLKDWPDYGQECEYVFDPADGKWWVSSPGQNPVGWNTVAAWHGFISIPDAIRLEKEQQERYEKERQEATA